VRFAPVQLGGRALGPGRSAAQRDGSVRART
jgi:hypothetical protein